MALTNEVELMVSVSEFNSPWLLEIQMVCFGNLLVHLIWC